MATLRNHVLQTERLPVGSFVYVRYRDHVLFRDSDPAKHQPWTRECVGWLDFEDPEYVRIVHERYAMPNPPFDGRHLGTGLVILKSTILELVDVRRLLGKQSSTPVYKHKDVYRPSRQDRGGKVETPQC